MNVSWQSRIIDALDLPVSTRVNQRVPKKLLVENGAPTAADKKRINEGIEEIHWLAALKPNTIGVAEYRDDVREYLEIALISVILRPGAKTARLAELVHRAVPYPVVLIMVQGDRTILSLAHKRRSHNEAAKYVLDEGCVDIDVSGADSISKQVIACFFEALSISSKTSSNILHLYQFWINAIVELHISRITGMFSMTHAMYSANIRREVMQQCIDLESKIITLRRGAAKETQISRQMTLNQDIKCYEEILQNLKRNLFN